MVDVPLGALEGQRDIEEAAAEFERRMTAGCVPVNARVGFQGGGVDAEVQWNKRERFWSLFDKVPGSRYWYCFGKQDPQQASSLGIDVEINPPLRGINRRCAGVFAKGPDGDIVILHSGKVGGGRRGIGKSAFLATTNIAPVPVRWSDGHVAECLPIGVIADKELPQMVAHFVGEVEAFKKEAVHGLSPAATSFSPEFKGRRRGYRVPGIVRATCRHGTVVAALRDQLCETVKQTCIRNDRERDLYVVGAGGRVKALFEVKTDTQPQSVYTGVGQLMLHGRAARPPRRFLVMPGRPTAKTAAALKDVGITLVPYDWSRGKVTFRSLPSLITSQ